jgi:hypothetical protein
VWLLDEHDLIMLMTCVPAYSVEAVVVLTV